MTVQQVLRLPAATSEFVEVDVLQYESDPGSITWASSASLTNKTLESGAPASIATAASAVNRGTADSPDWKIRVSVSGLSAGTYGVWVKAVGAAGSSPVRYCGQIVLY